MAVTYETDTPVRYETDGTVATVVMDRAKIISIHPVKAAVVFILGHLDA